MIRVIAALLFVWAGLLLGVSFVAVPAKFLAPSLPMAQALDVGRWTFHVLAWIECGFAVAAALLIAIAGRSGKTVSGPVAGLTVVVAIVLVAESFALRPLLDARVLRIMAGESVPPSPWHNAYIALEALRLALSLQRAYLRSGAWKAVSPEQGLHMSRAPHPKAPGTLVGITEPMIRTLVHTFYASVRTDRLLGPIFKSRDRGLGRAS